MSDFLLTSVSNASAGLLPLLVVQGIYARKRAPRLPDATGPTEGIIEANGSAIRLLVFGESTVAGMGAQTHEEALTGQTAKFLSQKTNRTVIWQAVGLSGVTAGRAIIELVPQIKNESVDVIAIALGVNDTLKFNSPRRWARDLSALIEAIRGRVGPVPVLLSSVPRLGLFPTLPQPLRGVLGLRAKVLDKASQKLVPTLANVTHLSLVIGGDRENFCEDGFHPSPLAYQKWGARLADEAAKLFQ
jgi:lysophospholipase L1-like esterase